MNAAEGTDADALLRPRLRVLGWSPPRFLNDIAALIEHCARLAQRGSKEVGEFRALAIHNNFQ